MPETIFESNPNRNSELENIKATKGASDLIADTKTKFSFPNKLIAALFLFGASGSVVAFSLPRLVSPSASPPFLMLLTTGLILITLMGFLLVGVPSMGLPIKRRALLLAFAVNLTVVVVKFIVTPLGLYSSNQQAPFIVGDPLTSSGLGSPIQIALGAFILYAFFLWLLKRHYLSKYSAESRANANTRTQFQRLLSSIGTIIATFMIVFVAYNFVGGILGVQAYLGEAGNIGMVFALLTVAFLLAVAAFRASYEQAKEDGSVIAISSIFWVMLSIILLYHVMWVIFTGALITIWPFKTVLPTPTK